MNGKRLCWNSSFDFSMNNLWKNDTRVKIYNFYIWKIEITHSAVEYSNEWYRQSFSLSYDVWKELSWKSIEYSIFWGWACTTNSSQHLCNHHVTWKWKLFSWKILLFLYCFLTVYQKYFSYVRSFLIIIFESLFQLCLILTLQRFL